MEVKYPNCAGLDIHKETIQACVRYRADGPKPRIDLREFRTTTRDILALGDWLARLGITTIAMESTGVFWKPIFNLLEDRFELQLWNAQHIKNVPGRKTDVVDCDWICQLLQFGLVRPSFVPDRPMRELRDLTRHRAQLVGEHTRIANRLHKTLEDANIKLASVASDILGKSGRAMIEALIAGETDPKVLANLAVRRLRSKIGALELALEGGVRPHHRDMLERLYKHLRFLEGEIEGITARIGEVLPKEPEPNGQSEDLPPLPFEAAVALLTTIPGVDQRTAENLVAGSGRRAISHHGPACARAITRAPANGGPARPARATAG
jgi:transposase